MFLFISLSVTFSRPLFLSIYVRMSLLPSVPRSSTLAYVRTYVCTYVRTYVRVYFAFAALSTSVSPCDPSPCASSLSPYSTLSAPPSPFLGSVLAHIHTNSLFSSFFHFLLSIVAYFLIGSLSFSHLLSFSRSPLALSLYFAVARWLYFSRGPWPPTRVLSACSFRPCSLRPLATHSSLCPRTYVRTYIPASLPPSILARFV